MEFKSIKELEKEIESIPEGYRGRIEENKKLILKVQLQTLKQVNEIIEEQINRIKELKRYFKRQGKVSSFNSARIVIENLEELLNKINGEKK